MSISAATLKKSVIVFTVSISALDTPYVDGASVKASLIKNGKAKKVTVFTYKPKKSSKRKMGHRQPYSKKSVIVFTVSISALDTPAQIISFPLSA